MQDWLARAKRFVLDVLPRQKLSARERDIDRLSIIWRQLNPITQAKDACRQWPALIANAILG
jgi:hypothetical protein